MLDGLFLSKIVMGMVNFRNAWIPNEAMGIIDMTASIRVLLDMETPLAHGTTRRTTGLKSRTFPSEPVDIIDVAVSTRVAARTGCSLVHRERKPTTELTHETFSTEPVAY
jgi:hypothetical protein